MNPQVVVENKKQLAMQRNYSFNSWKSHRHVDAFQRWLRKGTVIPQTALHGRLLLHSCQVVQPGQMVNARSPKSTWFTVRHIGPVTPYIDGLDLAMRCDLLRRWLGASSNSFQSSKQSYDGQMTCYWWMLGKPWDWYKLYWTGTPRGTITKWSRCRHHGIFVKVNMQILVGSQL